jgi:hypothetical protein
VVNVQAPTPPSAEVMVTEFTVIFPAAEIMVSALNPI